jgi:beta-galactosidase
MNMKRLIWIGLAACLAGMAATFAAEPTFFAPCDDARDRLFNDGWLYHRGDAKDAENSAFDDAKWRPVHLPHDWSVEPIPESELAPVEAISPVHGAWQYRDGDDDDFAKVDADLSGWKSAQLPRVMPDFAPKSYRWFRREIEMPTTMAKAGVVIDLGKISDCDELYVNGRKVGETGVMPKNQPQGNCIPATDTDRKYRVPAAALKPGRNLIAVCVYNDKGKGGFATEASKKKGNRGLTTDFDVVGPFLSTAIGGTASGYTVGGTGWYRKHFNWKQDDRHATIRFGGVMMNSDVWLNGRHLGFFAYGYVPFYYDLTPYLKDGDNVLAVRARNEGVTSRWYPGSGIYRNVWLTTTGATHIRPWGVWARTVSADGKQAAIEVDVEINGPIAGTTVRVELLGADGKVVATGEALAAGEKTTILLKVADPKLWDLDHPNLYTARATLVRGGKTIDQFAQTFGIRTIRFTAEKGFELNGRSIDMNGGCVHHDNGLLGAVAPYRADIRKVEILKEQGYNAVRTAHNPMSEGFYEACDRIGLLVMDEVFDVWSVHKTPDDYGGEAWEKGRAKDLENWLRSTRNHPSIVIRSLGNEIGNRHNKPEQVVKDLTALLAIARPFDSTRPFTGGTATISDRTDYMSHYDVQGYNYREDIALTNHQKFPHWVMIGTESNPGEKGQLKTWNFVQEHPWFTGCFVWSAFEYIGESWSGWVGMQGEEASWPSYAAACGLIDITGFPKGGQVYRRVMVGASLIEINVLEPLPAGQKYARKGWSWANEYPSWDWDGFEGQKVNVRVITRAPQLRLKLNGKIVGEGKTTKDSIDVVFKIPYQPGELVAEGLQNGKLICTTTLTTPGKPAALRLVADRSVITTSDNDLAYVSIKVVDNQGRLVTQGRHPVSVAVTGDGALEASGTGYHKDVHSFDNPDALQTYRGLAMAIVRPNQMVGTITVKAHSSQFGDAVLEIPVRETSEVK